MLIGIISGTHQTSLVENVALLRKCNHSLLELDKTDWQAIFTLSALWIDIKLMYCE